MFGSVIVKNEEEDDYGEGKMSDLTQKINRRVEKYIKKFERLDSTLIKKKIYE